MNEINFSEFTDELTIEVIFFRLFLAVIFGGIIGFEREIRHRPAGFRTHILVCVGAAVVSMIQDQLRLEIINFSRENGALAETLKSDLGRLGAQVVSGIGFLGAGSIIKGKGDFVAGMTTAAGIWATGCVGLGIGWGFYNIAFGAIVFMFVVMVLLKKLEGKLIKQTNCIDFEVEVKSKENIAELIIKCYQIMKAKSVVITEVNKDLESSLVSFNTIVPNEKIIPEIIISLSIQENVKSVRDYKK